MSGRTDGQYKNKFNYNYQAELLSFKRNNDWDFVQYRKYNLFYQVGKNTPKMIY